MPRKLLTYSDVLDVLKEKPTLLLGNGFSMAYDSKRFSFTSLLETAKKTNLIQTNSKLAKLFDVYNTTDFESIIKVLDDYVKTASVYNPEINLEYLKKEIANLKKYLVDTITNNHPDKITALKDSEIDSCIAFINRYDKIYTLNYDLLLYWVSIKLLDKSKHINTVFNPEDGFIHSEEFPNFVEFANEGTSKLHLLYLHGGLHLYDAGHKLLKLTYSQTNRPLKEQIIENLEREIYPIFISEGSSKQKLEKILHNAYLNTCFRKFQEINKDLVIFGTGLKKNDDHIAEAIINSKVENVYIGVSSINKISEWNTFASKIKEWNDENRRNSRSKRLDKKLHFYDYKTVNVWGH